MGPRRHGVLSAAVVTALAAGLLPSAVPIAASAAPDCDQPELQAEDLPELAAQEDCELVGRTVTAGDLALQVPPPGEGRSMVALTTEGEVSLEISTSPDGVVEVDTRQLSRHEDHHGDDAPQEDARSAAALRAAAGMVPGGETFAEAAPLTVPQSFEPEVGQIPAGAPLEPGEPMAGCAASAAGSAWYRLYRPGSLRRIKLRASVPLAVYRGTSLESLQRVACVGATGRDRVLKLAPTGVWYIQAAASQEDAAFGNLGAFWLTSAEMRPDGPPPCDVRVHKLLDDMAPRKPLKWRFNAASTPPSLTKAQALRGIRRGVGVITNAKNDCGMPDTVSARQAYLGRTPRKPTMCTQTRSDGVNTIGFGPASFGMLGVACSAWTISARGKRHVFESDMQLNSAVSWTMKPDAPGCRPNAEMDLIGVVAHEAGHVFGLDHPTGTKALNQTMSATQSACNGAFRTLGRGDVVALRKLY